MGRTIGGNPLRNAAIRQGNPLPRHRVVTTSTRHPSVTRPYTDEDRRRLLAPITISSFGGKSHAGCSHASHDSLRKGQQGDRYGFLGDWADLDRL